MQAMKLGMIVTNVNQIKIEP